MLSAALHLVGRVLRQAAERAPDLADGRQHDSAEFVLRLLRALGHEPAFRCDASHLWYEVAGRVRVAECRGAAEPPKSAVAAVAYTGSAVAGHYTGMLRGPGGGWGEAGGQGFGAWRGGVCLWFELI